MGVDNYPLTGITNRYRVASMNEKIQKYVGKQAVVEMGAFIVKVEILDVKNTYGKDRFLVTPVAGKGEAWVEKLILD